MDFITDYKIENFILNTQWEDIPDEIKERAIRCSIDLIGALILGSQGNQYKAGIKAAETTGLFGNIPVFGGVKSFNLLGASIAFSHASNSFDIDDGYNMVKGHPGASFVGGVLAAALEKNCTYKEYLATLVICYETAIRWGLAEQDHYGFLHSTGTYGAFGTAAGIGKIKGLNKEQLNNALSIADYHAPLTPVMRAVEYPSMNKDGVPFGSLVGTMAVIETLCGETGKTHLLELLEYEYLLDSLYDRYYIKELYFKPYTCCRWAHQPIKACQDLMRKYEFSYDQIKKVTINTFDSASKLSKSIPKDTDEAQYNIAFPVASALVFGDVGFDQIKDKAVTNKEVIKMMRNLEFKVDPDMEKEFPEKRLAWVNIELVNGTEYKSDVYAAPGEHTDPNLDYDWIVSKFKRVTAPIINSQSQDLILKYIGKESDVTMIEIMDIINEQLKMKG